MAANGVKELTDRQHELVARICHAGWVAYQMGCGQDYRVEPDADDLASHRDGIEAILRDPEMTAERNHQNWMRFRLSQGWQYGPQKYEGCECGHPLDWHMHGLSEIPAQCSSERECLCTGWREVKTHPDLVPYDELPEVERRKDEMDVMMRRLALMVVVG